MLIIHRVVGIEEPNDKHSERYFLFQGDAISRHDVYPVLYSQMKAIYEGERIPFLGSIITFIQSPAGWLCFILILFGIIVTPIIENKLLNEMRKRLALLDGRSDYLAPVSVRAKVRKPGEPEDDEFEGLKITSIMTEYNPEAKQKDNHIKFTVKDVIKKKGEIKLVITDDAPDYKDKGADEK